VNVVDGSSAGDWARPRAEPQSPETSALRELLQTLRQTVGGAPSRHGSPHGLAEVMPLRLGSQKGSLLSPSAAAHHGRVRSDTSP
jgi:hypothetical protein